MRKIVTAPKQPASALRVFTDGLLLILTLTGTIYSITSLYDGLTRTPAFILAVCLITGLLALAAFSLPKYRWAAVLGLALCYTALGYWFWPELRAGAEWTLGHVLELLDVSLPAGFEATTVRGLTDYEASSFFLAMFLAALSLPLGWSVVRGRSAILTFLLTFSWLLPGLVDGRSPGWGAFLLLLGCWCLLLLSDLCARDDANGGARFTLLCLPAVALLLGLVQLFLPMEDYQRPEWTDDARAYLQDAASGLLEADGALDTVTELLGGSDPDVSVRLDDAGPRSFGNDTVLRVTSDVRGRVYLRGASSAVYAGDTWDALDPSDYEDLDLETYSPLNFPSMGNPDRPFREMTIEYQGLSGGWLYTPYDLSTTPDEISGVTFVDDSYLERSFGVQKKNVFFRPISGPPETPPDLPWDAARAEAAYRRFVYDHYLETPVGFEAVRQKWLDSFPPETLREIMDAAPYYGIYGNTLANAQVIASLLAEDSTYDLDTPFTPEGEDFVDYFLNESHRGYCVHYASAGVLLLRSLGVPARYVTGYTVEIPASGEAEVKDSAAHAWVEIYLDGYGWYPVEMTPASGTGIEPDALTAPPDQPEEPEPEEPEEPEKPDKPAPERPDREEEPDRPEPSSPEDTDPPEAEEDGSWPTAVWIVLSVAGVAAMVPLRCLLCRALRRRRFQSADTNQAVLAAYGYLQRLAPWGTDADALLGSLARKARFSQHRLSEQERARALLAVTEERARLEKTLPRGKRWLLRFLWAL